MNKQPLRYYYYAFSLLLMGLFPLISHLTGDMNLPPLKPISRFLINLIFINLCLAYLWLIAHKKGPAVPRKCWWIFIIIGIALCTLRPVFSVDFYEYLIRGRILGVYHQNPYTYLPIEFPSDMFYSYSFWKKNAEGYGPAWYYLSAVIPALFKNSFFLTMVMQKIMIFTFLMMSGVLFHRIALKVSPGHADWLTRMFVLNPNLIVQHVIDGHNDIVMVFWMLSAIYILLQKGFLLSLVMGTIAVCTKMSSIVLLPVLGVYSMKAGPYPTMSKRLLYIGAAVSAVVGTTAGLYATLWAGKDMFQWFKVFDQWFYSNTIPYAAHQLVNILGWKVEPRMTAAFFKVFFVLNFIASLGWLMAQKPLSPKRLFQGTAWIFIAVYASYALSFCPWHLSWGFPFIILSQWPYPGLLAFLYGAIGVFSYFKRINFLFLLGGLCYFIFLSVSRKNQKLTESLITK